MTDIEKDFDEWLKNYHDAYNTGVAYGRANPVLQPIETAPKDGVDVCFWRGEFMKVACYIKERGQYLDKHDSYKRYLDINDFDGWTPIPKVTNE